MAAYSTAAALVENTAPGMSRREKATAQVYESIGATTSIVLIRGCHPDFRFMNVLLRVYDVRKSPECSGELLVLFIAARSGPVLRDSEIFTRAARSD